MSDKPPETVPRKLLAAATCGLGMYLGMWGLDRFAPGYAEFVRQPSASHGLESFLLFLPGATLSGLVDSVVYRHGDRRAVSYFGGPLAIWLLTLGVAWGGGAAWPTATYVALPVGLTFLWAVSGRANDYL